MSKITQYLNEHILGEVTSNKSVLEQFSRDGSILNIKPELVVSPRTTNDIRKVARFTWQLAEKGHCMPITTRGSGSDRTGGAIGKGIIVNTLAHLNNIIFVSLKNKNQFIHVQPGIQFNILNEVLKSHGMNIPGNLLPYGTIGGAVANNYGGIGDLVSRMEVILANGDLIETSRITRHELDKKKGLQTFEGEIYRKIDGIIEDNEKLIADKANNELPTNTGYSGITRVKQRDGSFDLSPLIIGSQGTLGVISEIVVKTDFYGADESVMVIPFENARIARDAADIFAQLKPNCLDLIDGRLFSAAENVGKHYLFTDELKNIGAVMYISFNDFSDSARRHKMKQVVKKLAKLDATATVFTSDENPVEELTAIHEVSAVVLQPETPDESLPPLIDGACVPAIRREEFLVALDELAAKHHTELPTQINWLTGIVDTRDTLKLHVISDKQKVFKLIGDYAELVARFGGSLTGNAGEGRTKATAIYAQLDDELLGIYKQIRETFDPFGTMNPGVKQIADLKTLVSQMNPDYSLADFAKYSPRI
ncbi:MAG: FAD-binding oxidoreductase [Candidatus Saccharibacteria bacterium]